MPGRQQVRRYQIALAVVAGGDSDQHVGHVEVVDGHRHQILDAPAPPPMLRLTMSMPSMWAAVSASTMSLRAGVYDIAGEDVVVAQQRMRSDARHVVGLATPPTVRRRVVAGNGAGKRGCHGCIDARA
jgi:hypothetical protein